MTTLKNNLYIIISLLGLTMILSCEDVIDVDLAEVDAQYVVDAWLHDMDDRLPEVRIGLSQPYFDSSFQESLENASVRITTGDNNIYSLIYNPDTRSYQFTDDELSVWRAEPVGQTFALDIDVNDSQLTAQNEKFRVPDIDSILQELRTDDPFVDDGIFCNFFATDLEGVGDTYWVRTFKNGDYLNKPAEINITFDAGFSPGGEVDNLVFIQPIQELNNPVDENFAPIPYLPGDSIRVELHSISNSAFFFMEVLRDQLLNSSNGIFAEPLANTNGNISSSDGIEVLGFFNVSSVSIIEEEILEQ